MVDLGKIKHYKDVLAAIGQTPLVKLDRVARNVKPYIFAKLESFNPSGSVKDRIALAIVEDAERRGVLKPGGTIVEATGGNTGASLAMVAARKGYKAIFVVPDKMSQEKIRLMKSFGAQVLITPSAVPPDSPEYYVQMARHIHEETPNSIYTNQFYNPVNPECHYETTGAEIWDQTGGQIDYFVGGMGTGGTISGVARYLKEKNPEIKIVVSDPKGSIIRDYFYTKRLVKSAPYQVEGIGEDMIPPNHHYQYIDEVYTITDEESFTAARNLARQEGLFVGGSSGTALATALKLAHLLNDEKVIVVLFSDSGERYLSKFHSDEWMKENRYLQAGKIEVDFILAHKDSQTPAIVSVTPEALVEEALNLMKHHNVSQIPVFDKDQPVGMINEGIITGKVLESREVLRSPVASQMEKDIAVVDASESIDGVIKLMTRKNSSMLVRRYDRIVGIVTRYDLIEYFTQ